VMSPAGGVSKPGPRLALPGQPGYVRAVQSADGYRRQVGALLGTRQRRLLLLDGLALCALAESPLAGIESEALAIAPLVVASLAALHVAAAVSGRRRRRVDAALAAAEPGAAPGTLPL
jgi:hypothetical protein